LICVRDPPSDDAKPPGPAPVPVARTAELEELT
jgi:hypothetical protein